MVNTLQHRVAEINAPDVASTEKKPHKCHVQTQGYILTQWLFS
jgi:hypothetical protein